MLHNNISVFLRESDKEMNLAIVNQTASTGGWRYLYMLVKNIVQLRPDFDITIFINDITGIEEAEKLKQIGIKMQPIENPREEKLFERKIFFHIHFFDHIYNTIRKRKYKKRCKKNAASNKNALDTLNKYDVVFYAWPYGIVAPDITKPLFFIPHDFIISHGFGVDGCGFYYKDLWFKSFFPQLKTFVDKKAIPIVSSEFIKDEYNRVFPDSENKPHVVYLSKFNEYKKKSPVEIQNTLDKYDIHNDYILFANNNMPHKNLSQVIAAMYYVKQKHPDVKLVISGYRNNDILGKINCPYYMDHTEKEDDWDIKGIGLLSDADFSAVLQGAKMCINASFCEAGAGSGIDAWSIGTPMVMSDIPSFKNQIEFLGVKAELFEPREARDIARAIIKLLDNPDLVRENVEISQKAMERYTWEIVAQKYINLFEEGRNGV